VDAALFLGIAGAPEFCATVFALTIPPSLLQRADQVIE